MIERLDIRMFEKVASQYISPEIGDILGPGVRKLVIETSDPMTFDLKRIEAELRSPGNMLVSSVSINRSYTQEEIAAATYFRVTNFAFSNQGGEEWNTRYIRNYCCPVCEAGEVQKGPLRLNLSMLSRRRDAYITIAGERVVSCAFVEAFQKAEITGVEFGPVYHRKKSLEPSEEWFQLIVKNAAVSIVPPTIAGNNFFDHDLKGEYKCPMKDNIGLNLISEAHIKPLAEELPDVFFSKEYLGYKRGLLKPQRQLFFSKKAMQQVWCQKLKGVQFEIAHVVE